MKAFAAELLFFFVKLYPGFSSFLLFYRQTQAEMVFFLQLLQYNSRKVVQNACKYSVRLWAYPLTTGSVAFLILWSAILSNIWQKSLNSCWLGLLSWWSCQISICFFCFWNFEVELKYLKAVSAKPRPILLYAFRWIKLV